MKYEFLRTRRKNPSKDMNDTKKNNVEIIWGEPLNKSNNIVIQFEDKTKGCNI